ncbi:putative F-box domain, leucine-rich repeat domain superfamily, F-box-like domain superfamily [Helianthus annuus]|nr:putative F-box domain, leucine-rich repeat domain superfamily, F-box-like domain superfamily [Helianthus annuus]
MAVHEEEEDDEEEEETKVDRLSDMPESLQLRILSCLDASHAVGTSLLSKSWGSLWTRVPILNFSSYEGFKHLHVFDDFVVNALSRRAPVKLDRLTFKRDGKCSPKLLQTVFDYAFLHGVRELEAHIEQTIRDHESWTWPIWSSDSLTSFKVRCNFVVGCPYLELRSGSFKNLTALHLQGVIIKDLDMFSGFQALDKLRLLHCFVKTNGKALHVHAQQLSEFTFFFRNQNVNCCEMMTPKLRYFEWGGNSLPRLKAHLPVLDTVVIAYNGHCLKEREKIMFDNLLMMFNTFYTAKSLMVSAHAICISNAGCF